MRPLLPFLLATAVIAADADPLAGLRAARPRLLVTPERWAALPTLHERDPLFARCRTALIATAEKALALPPPERVLKGPRLLEVSRDVLRRVQLLTVAWRLTGREEFAVGAERVALAAAAFSDWNPSHFLDVAEMATALTLVHDWQHARLSPEVRTTLRAAIVAKAFAPAKLQETTPFWWVTSEFNWNQVCNGGLAVAALGLADEHPAEARALVARAVAHLPRALASYDPDGAWGEGPGYWTYATDYTVYALGALTTALGDDRGLGERAGLRAAGDAPLALTGPTGLVFNYADSGERSARRPLPVLFWLAQRYRRPELAAAELAFLAADPQRVRPLHLLWWPEGVAPAEPSLPSRAFRGAVEVAVLRAGEGKDALWLAVKAGFNQVNHGQLDIGAFELDALGVRWARDLGSDDYNLPGYWDKKPGGRRWSYYRMSARSHSVPLVDGQDQDALATAALTAFDAAGALAVIDYGGAYAPAASRARRGVRLVDGRAVLVQDEFAFTGTHRLTWAMTTDAAISLEGAAATLTLDGRTLRARILSPAEATFSQESAEREPPEKRNAGVRRLLVDLPAAHGDTTVAVLLTPGEAAPPAPTVVPLDRWLGPR